MPKEQFDDCQSSMYIRGTLQWKWRLWLFGSIQLHV